MIFSSAERTAPSILPVLSVTSTAIFCEAVTIRELIVSSMRVALSSKVVTVLSIVLLIEFSIRSALSSRVTAVLSIVLEMVSLSDARRSAVMSARAVMASGRVLKRSSTISVMALRALLTPASIRFAVCVADWFTVAAADSTRALMPLSASDMRATAFSIPRPRLSLTWVTLAVIISVRSVDLVSMVLVTFCRLASIFSLASIPCWTMVLASS